MGYRWQSWDFIPRLLTLSPLLCLLTRESPHGATPEMVSSWAVSPAPRGCAQGSLSEAEVQAQRSRDVSRGIREAGCSDRSTRNQLLWRCRRKCSFPGGHGVSGGFRERAHALPQRIGPETAPVPPLTFPLQEPVSVAHATAQDAGKCHLVVCPKQKSGFWGAASREGRCGFRGGVPWGRKAWPSR